MADDACGDHDLPEAGAAGEVLDGYGYVEWDGDDVAERKQANRKTRAGLNLRRKFEWSKMELLLLGNSGDWADAKSSLSGRDEELEAPDREGDGGESDSGLLVEEDEPPDMWRRDEWCGNEAEDDSCSWSISNMGVGECERLAKAWAEVTPAKADARRCGGGEGAYAGGKAT
ncbi:hypothetical protein HDU93_000089 [Gonapodya sp. JEL0774]|nr:hypothetical protein HDU93_000089 [Gonapodya sp. JEL0774]